MQPKTKQYAIKTITFELATRNHYILARISTKRLLGRIA